MAVQLQKWHQCDLARTGWLFQTSKTTTAWWLASNLRSMPLAMTYQINNQDPRQGIFHHPQHKAGSPWKTNNRCLPKTSQLDIFALHLLCSGSFSTMVAVPEFWFLRSRLCCKDLRSNVPNDHHSLEHRCRTWIAILCYLCSSVRLFHTAGWAMRLCVRRVW